MRRYCFANGYTSGLRAGIQSGHAAEEMWVATVESYLNDDSQSHRDALFSLLTFARDHKTWIILNGGDHEALTDLYTFLSDSKNPYLFSKFHEPGLNNALTSVSIVLPERMYDDVANAVGKAILYETADVEWMDQLDDYDLGLTMERKYTDWEREFLKRKAMCGLAS